MAGYAHLGPNLELAGQQPDRDAQKSEIHPPPIEFTAAEIAVDDVLQFFHYAHLPQHMQSVSAKFCQLARFTVANVKRCPQRTIALNKLLEAKDAAVRAAK